MSVAAAGELLERLNVSVKADWADEALRAAVLAPFRLDDRALLYDQWLHADIKECAERNGVTPLPPPNFTGVLSTDTCVQLQWALDCGSSYYGQYRALGVRRRHDGNEQVDAAVTGTESRPWEPTDQRCLYMAVTDGVRHLKAFEHGRTPALHDRLPPGTKLLLAKGTAIRRGVLLLDANNVRVLGGYVKQLCVKHVLDRMLAEKIKQPVTADEMHERLSAAVARGSADAFARTKPSSQETAQNDDALPLPTASDVDGPDEPDADAMWTDSAEMQEEDQAPAADDAYNGADEDQSAEEQETFQSNEPCAANSAADLDEEDLFDSGEAADDYPDDVDVPAQAPIQAALSASADRRAGGARASRHNNDDDIVRAYAAVEPAAVDGRRRRSAVACAQDEHASFWPEPKADRQQQHAEVDERRVRTLQPSRLASSFEPSYVYLSSVVQPAAGNFPSVPCVRTVKAVVTGITARLSNGHGVAWSMKIVLCDGSASAECEIADSALTSHLGMTAAEAQRIRASGDAALQTRGNRAIEAFTRRLQRLDLLFRLSYYDRAGPARLPLVLDIHTVGEHAG